MILNIYKPVQWTSFDVVKKIRVLTKEKKVGHAGTLDPFAEGVLIIGTGKDTKSLGTFSSTEKSYVATLKLGFETNTMDTEGKVVSESNIPNLKKIFVQNTLKSFLGKQEQIPPMYSAKKINGVKLYELARKNIEVERKPINIMIHDIELLSVENDSIEFSVNCSKGTYIRVLGHDIAKKLGTVGHLTKLIRTAVGKKTINDSMTIDEFEKRWKNTST